MYLYITERYVQIDRDSERERERERDLFRLVEVHVGLGRVLGFRV